MYLGMKKRRPGRWGHLESSFGREVQISVGEYMTRAPPSRVHVSRPQECLISRGFLTLRWSYPFRLFFPILLHLITPITHAAIWFWGCFVVMVIIEVIWNRGGRAGILQIGVAEVMPRAPPNQPPNPCAPPPASNPFGLFLVWWSSSASTSTGGPWSTRTANHPEGLAVSQVWNSFVELKSCSQGEGSHRIRGKFSLVFVSMKHTLIIMPRVQKQRHCPCGIIQCKH